MFCCICKYLVNFIKGIEVWWREKDNFFEGGEDFVDMNMICKVMWGDYFILNEFGYFEFFSYLLRVLLVI